MQLGSTADQDEGCQGFGRGDRGSRSVHRRAVESVSAGLWLSGVADAGANHLRPHHPVPGQAGGHLGGWREREGEEVAGGGRQGEAR